MSKRQAKRRRTDAAMRKAFSEYPVLRIRWIDRLTTAIDSHPGAPPSSEVSQAARHLRQVLLTYREGFVHALNLTKARR